MTRRIQFKRGPSPDPTHVLVEGEPGYDLTNKIFKIGDGVTPWGQLAPQGAVSSEEIQEAVEAYLEANPATGDFLTEDDLAAALAAHRDSLSPHGAYDDMPSLTLLFQNGLI